jgi:hypothetical protein
MSEVLPAYYYYPLLVFDVVSTSLDELRLGLRWTIRRPRHPQPHAGFRRPATYGLRRRRQGRWTVQQPYRPCRTIRRSQYVQPLTQLTIVGPVWAIMTSILIPLARNGLKDRPDLAEKVVRAHMLAGALVDVSTTFDATDLAYPHLRVPLLPSSRATLLSQGLALYDLGHFRLAQHRYHVEGVLVSGYRT